MQQIRQNAKRLVSVCLATLLILVSTITIFPSTASADINVFKLECKSKSNCGNTFSFAAGVASGSAITLMATGDTATLATVAATGAAIGQTTVTALGGLGAAAGTAVSSPVLVPVGVTAAGGYGVYKLWHHFRHNQSQNAN